MREQGPEFRFDLLWILNTDSESLLGPNKCQTEALIRIKWKTLERAMAHTRKKNSRYRGASTIPRSTRIKRHTNRLICIDPNAHEHRGCVGFPHKMNYELFWLMPNSTKYVIYYRLLCMERIYVFAQIVCVHSQSGQNISGQCMRFAMAYSRCCCWCLWIFQHRSTHLTAHRIRKMHIQKHYRCAFKTRSNTDKIPLNIPSQ